MLGAVPKQEQKLLQAGGLSDEEFAIKIASGYFGKIGDDPDKNHGAIIPVTIWGRNEDVEDGGVEILTSATVTLQTADIAHEVLSSDADDDDGDTGARTVRVYCVAADGGVFYQDATMNGTSVVALATNYQYTLWAEVLTAGSSGTNEGLITVQTAAADVFQAGIVAGRGRSTEGIFVVPDDYDLVIRRLRGYALATANTNNAGLDVEFSATVQESSAQVMYASGNAGLAGADIAFDSRSIPSGAIFRMKSQEVGGASTKALMVANGYLLRRGYA